MEGLTCMRIELKEIHLWQVRNKMSMTSMFPYRENGATGQVSIRTNI